ncbi:MAG: MFS transporter [Acidobacteriota bacterium]|nr:MFS transporter [Acidobacteriota bacterium]
MAKNAQTKPISGQQWRVLFAAQAGYMLDAMDVLLYVFALNTLRTEFHLTNAAAGSISSVTLVFSALGGIGAGILADRFGRKRLLVLSILLYSLASAGTATAGGVYSLLFWRALVGLGLGGEWSAGAVLVAETWPAVYRGRAIGFMQAGWALGYLLAAGLAALILPRFGWRMLFLAGVLPALLAFAIRRGIAEPAVWRESRNAPRLSWISIFRPPLRRRTVLATSLTTSVLFAYWGLFTWLPGYLSAPRAAGGAGFSLVKTSGYLAPMQVGAFFGYVSFGFVSQRMGRRAAFLLYMLVSAALAPAYGLARESSTLLLLGPLVGFFGSGYFSLFGSFLAELYPTAIRGSAQGFTYNFGRGLSALAPLFVGALADRNGIGTALALNSAFFLIAAALVFTLPGESYLQE